jgi:hypothetical protein
MKNEGVLKKSLRISDEPLPPIIYKKITSYVTHVDVNHCNQIQYVTFLKYISVTKQRSVVTHKELLLSIKSIAPDLQKHSS